MLNYVIQSFYPHIWHAHQGENGANAAAAGVENGAAGNGSGKEVTAASHEGLQPMWIEFLEEVSGIVLLEGGWTECHRM